MTPNVFIVEKIEKVSYKEFVEHWSRGYDYPREALYNSIEQEHFSSEDVRNLFEWKNGMKPSANKLKSIALITAKLNLVNRLKQNYSQIEFNDNFGHMSNIWQIFLMHIIQPKSFPIFDQYVYFSYNYIQDKSIDIPANYLTSKATLDLYLRKYVPFFKAIEADSGLEGQTIDRALWVFGRYIKNNKSLVVSK